MQGISPVYKAALRTVDPENAGAKLSDPQSWNAYSYAGNSPVTFHDPSGLWKEVPCNSGKCNSGKLMCWEAEKATAQAAWRVF